MTVDKKYTKELRAYVEPLTKLQNAFNAAGMPIAFHLTVDPVYGKVIKVIGGFASQKIICIDADSPVAAVKDIAAGVKIS